MRVRTISLTIIVMMIFIGVTGCNAGDFLFGGGGDGFPDRMVDVTPGWYNIYASDVAVKGDYAFVADRTCGLQVFNIADADNPVWETRLITPGEPRELKISGNYIYLAAEDGGLHVIDIASPLSPDIVNTLTFEYPAYGLDIDGSMLYAATGGGSYTSDAGALEIVDISAPESPVVINSVETPGPTMTVDIDNGYAYVAAGYTGLRIMDVDPAESAHTVSVYGELPSPQFTGGDVYDVVVSNGWAFTNRTGGELNPNVLGILDVSDPENPFRAEEFFFDGYVSGSGPIVIDGNILYMTKGTEFRIYDILSHDPATLLCTVPEAGGKFSVKNGMVYVAGGGLKVIDATDLSNAEVRGSTSGISAGYSIDVVDGLLLQGYFDNLNIYDVSDFQTAEIISSIEVYGCIGDFDVHNNLIYMIANPVQVYSIADPHAPVFVREIEISENPHCLDVSSDMLYVGDYYTLSIYDISDPDSSFRVGSVGDDLGIFKIIVSGDYAYCSSRDEKFFIIDVSIPAEPEIIKTIEMDRAMDFLLVSGEYVYTTGNDGLQIIDINPPADASVVKTIPDIKGDLEMSGGYLYIGRKALTAYNVDNPLDPVEIGTIELYDYTSDLSISGQYAFLNIQCYYLQIIQLWD